MVKPRKVSKPVQEMEKMKEHGYVGLTKRNLYIDLHKQVKNLS